MGSRRPTTPLGWAMLLLAVVASCLASVNGVATEEEQVDCGSHMNCSTCLTSYSILNSSCQWLDCKEMNQSRCKNQTNKHEDCTVYKILEQCSVTPNGTTSTPPRTITTIPTPGNATNSTSPSPKVTTSATVTVTTTAIPGTQSPRKATFDASSFIGGIVLVLGLQAVIFFLYKFCKSKDQNYHTL